MQIMKKIERIQTGLRLEKRLLKVLKATIANKNCHNRCIIMRLP